MKQLKDVKPLVGTRISTGSLALDHLLGHERSDKRCGFRVPSIVLLTGEPGVGKTTLLKEIVNPSLLFGDRVPGSATVIKMVADHVLTKAGSVLVVDCATLLDAEEVVSLGADNRLVIVVQHIDKRKVKQQLLHSVSVWLHMERRMKGRLHVGTTLWCGEKNRFGETGEVFRLTGSSFWQSE